MQKTIQKKDAHLRISHGIELMNLYEKEPRKDSSAKNYQLHLNYNSLRKN